MRIHRVVLLLVLSALAALGLSFGANASADPSAYPPSTGCTVSTSDQSVAPGAGVTITGSGFPASSSVQLTMQSGAAVGTVQTDSQGSFSTHVTIPASATSNDRVVAAAGSTTCSFGLNAASHGTPPQTPNGSTAYTGFAAVTASVIALALLAGGVLFVVIGRRRRA